MKTAVIMLTGVLLLMIGCGPKNKTIGKDTDIRVNITIENNSGTIDINPGISPSSGDTGPGGVDNLAEQTANLEDLVRLSQPGSNMSGESQESPTATSTVDNSQTESNNTETKTPVAKAPPVVVAPVVAPTTETTETTIDPKDPIVPVEEVTDPIEEVTEPTGEIQPLVVHHVFVKGDGVAPYDKTPTIVQCPGDTRFESCDVEGVQFDYKGLDAGRHFWAAKTPGLMDRGRVLACWKGGIMYRFESEGYDHFGACK